MGETILAVNAFPCNYALLLFLWMDLLMWCALRQICRSKICPCLIYDQTNLFLGTRGSLVAMVVYLLFPDLILRLLTNDAHIITATKGYLFWTLLIPIAGFAAFLWDGIFIGATASVEMRNAMILSTIIFFGSYFLMTPVWGNNGLWFSFILYLATRGITLTFMARKAFKQA